MRNDDQSFWFNIKSIASNWYFQIRITEILEIAFDYNELLLGLFLQGYSVKEIYSLGEFILRENGDYKNLESFQNSTESNKKGIILS